MKNSVNTVITAALLEEVKERGGETEVLLASVDLPPELLSSTSQYVSNETFIVLMAEARQMLKDPDLPGQVGRRVANKLLTPSLCHAFGLRPEEEKIESVAVYYLRSFFLQLAVKLGRHPAAGLVVEVSRKDDSLYTHNHCLFLRGFLEALVHRAGGAEIVVSQKSCLVPVDRAGDTAAGRYRIDDDGRIWRRDEGRECEPFLEEEVGSLNEDHSHLVEGVLYGAPACSYEVRWRDPRSRGARLWSRTAGRIAQFSHTIAGLEQNREAESTLYSQISREWGRWLKWEPTYVLTRNKYLSYLLLLVITVFLVAAGLWISSSASPGRLLFTCLLPLVIPVLGHLLIRTHLASARQMIRHQEEMEKFFRSAPVGVAVIQPDYTLEYMNPLVIERHGEVRGQKCYAVFKWEVEPCPDCPVHSAFTLGQPAQSEVRYLDQDGQTRWFHLAATPLLDADGRVTSVVTVSTDLTERKRLEMELHRHREELAASENRYRSFMTYAADPILITGPEHEILEANHKALQLLGIENLDPFVGWALFETNFVIVDDRLRLRDLFERMIDDRMPRSFETRLCRSDGTLLEVEGHSIPIIRDGKAAWIHTILRDVTDRKQEEREKNLLLALSYAIKDAPDLNTMLQESLERLCRGIQAPVGAIFLRNPEKKQLHLSSQVGMAGHALQKLANIIMESQLSDVANRGALLKRALLLSTLELSRMSQENRNFFERTGLKAAGSFPLLVEEELEGVVFLASDDPDFFSPRRISLLKHVANELAVGISKQRLHDLLRKTNDELREKNQQLQSATLQLVQSEKMASLGQLAAGVAHEINNPIGYINSNLNMLKVYREDLISILSLYQQMLEHLKRSPLSAPLDELAAMIEEFCSRINLAELLQDMEDMINESLEGADRVTNIVKSLKDFSHPEGGEARWADLHDCLESTLRIVWNELKYKADVKREYGELPPVKCYPQELKQVFMNILVNAAQAIESRGEIRVCTYTEQERMVVEISDTGVGMTDDQLPHIFDPFYTTKEVGKGTGLGLSISYSIVKKHGGEIEVESKPGAGSTFRIKLPREAPSLSNTPSSPPVSTSLSSPKPFSLRG